MGPRRSRPPHPAIRTSASCRICRSSLWARARPRPGSFPGTATLGMGPKPSWHHEAPELPRCLPQHRPCCCARVDSRPGADLLACSEPMACTGPTAHDLPPPLSVARPRAAVLPHGLPGSCGLSAQGGLLRCMARPGQHPRPHADPTACAGGEACRHPFLGRDWGQTHGGWRSNHHAARAALVTWFAGAEWAPSTRRA